MARTNTDKLKLPKHDTGDLNWGGDFNEGLDALDEYLQRETLRPPRTLTAQLGSGAVGAYLLGNTTYYYKVTAINSVGESTEGKIPVVVEALVTQGATPVPVLLEWEAVAGATGYRVYKAASSGAEKFLVEKSGGSTVTHTDDGNTDTTTTDVPSSNTARASVTGIRKTGEPNPLRGDVKLKPGSGIALTQLPGTNEIEIASPADVLTHALGGAAHTADTLANLNAKISDATLVDQAAVILQALADAKGDIIVASGADAFARLAVGADGKFLKSNSGAAYGVEWADPPGGGSETVVVAAPTGTPATDTANIQNALNSLGAAGGTVVLAEGAYVLNAAIDFPAAKPIWFKGQGEATVVALDATFAGTSPVGVFKGPASGAFDNIRFSHMTLDAGSDPRKARWIRLVPPSGTEYKNIRFDHLLFLDHSVAIDLAGFGAGGIDGVRVEHCRSRECTKTVSILRDYTKRILIAHNDFRYTIGDPSSAPAVMVGGTDAEDIIIADNHIHHPHSSGDTFACMAFAVGPERCTITGNVFSGRQGIYASGVTLTDFVISGNLFHTTNGTRSIYLSSSSLVNSVVSGNKASQAFEVAGGSGNYYIGNKATLALSDTSPVIINENPINQSLLSTQGDLVVRGASVAERLAKGTDGQVLTMVTGAPAWAAAAGGGGGYATVVVDAPTGDATTDTAAVNAAIAALPAAGGKILFREGTYALNTITCPATKPVWWQGQGETTILAFAQATAWNMNDTPDQWFTDMAITLSGANSAVWNMGGTATPNDDCRFERLTITHNITATDGWTWWMQGTLNRLSIRDCRITVNKSQAAGQMIGLSGLLNYFTMQGNYINMAQPSIGDGIIKSYNGPIRYFNISDNVIIAGGGYFIHFDNWCHHGVVANNTFHSTGDPGGTQIEKFKLDANPLEDVAFTGNEIHIASATADKSIAFGQVSGVVRRCSFTGNVVYAENNAAGMIVSGTGLEFSENVVTGNRLEVVKLLANAASTANVIVGNRATVTDSSGGTNTVASNG